MPLIQVTAPQGALSKQDQDALISRLSDAVLRSEGASPGDPAAQALVWGFYHETPKGSCYVGGKTLDNAPLRIAVQRQCRRGNNTTSSHTTGASSHKSICAYAA